MKKLLASMLSLCLTLSLTALPSSALDLEDAKDLLQTYYVDQIPEKALSADSVAELLEALGDPYTTYLTAEEYQGFLDSVNGQSVVGIGVSISTAFDNGYPILSVLPNSPALEAGLEAGDRIVAVDGATVTAGTELRALIGGEEGTSVTVTVIRQADGRQKDYPMVRRTVATPIVTYDTLGSAGVINCVSFGESTVATVEEALHELNDQVSVWIMDLRGNPGGTSDAAAGSAGLFMGGGVMVYLRDSSGKYNYLYTGSAYPDLTDKPLIVMTSPYSASGSELFAAAARDHGFGIAVGQRTFGKGIAQIVLDKGSRKDLFDGDAIRITAYRFFSPDGATNHTVGILPTLLLSKENTPVAAQLLSSPEPKPHLVKDYLRLELCGHTFYLDQKEAVKPDNKAAFTELLEALPPAAVLSQGSSSGKWTQIEPAKLAAKLRLDFTARSFPDIEGSPFQREIETLAAYQLLSGDEQGRFDPEGTLTRAEFCSMVSNALALPANDKNSHFSDVNAGDWYADAVSAMAAKGFISGFGDGTFRPNDTITYEQVVTVLSTVAAWCSMEGYDLVQQEVPVGEWLDYYEFSDWAQTPARTLDKLGSLVGGELAPLLSCHPADGRRDAVFFDGEYPSDLELTEAHRP